MISGREQKHDERGLSARYLVLVFLTGVGACAVFFSLGFLVGYNERGLEQAEAAEQVTPPPVIPPTVNPPLEQVETTGRTPPPATSAGSQSARQAGSATSTAEAKSKPATPPAAAPASVPPARAGEVAAGYAVQVSASRAKEDAERLVRELSSRGYPVFLVTPEYAGVNDNLFRVQVGPFATREAAEKTRDQLAKEGFKPFIRH